MGLGTFGTFTLAQARERAREARQMVAQGIDPIGARRKAVASAPVTFAQATDRFMQQPRWRNAKHKAQWRTTLATYAFPTIGNLSVADVDRRHVMAILEPIWFVKNETASRVRGRIEAILDWAKVHRLREGENPAAFKGNLSHALPAKSKVRKVQHHPALPYTDLPTFMSAVRAQSGRGAQALQFCILTATRTGEAIKARWSEIDLDARLWTVPAERMKAKRDHQVPLSDQAIELLTQLRGGQGEDFVFPGTKPGSSISNMAMLKLLERMGRDDVTVHGFRSTFRVWAAEATEYPREVAEAALAHVVADKTEAAYQRSSFLDKRRRMMQAWGAFCADSQPVADVIPLRRP
jgi:integrase